MSTEGQRMLPRRGFFTCEDCGATGVLLRACEHGGWKVTCTHGHEVFPLTGTTLVVKGRAPEPRGAHGA